MNRWIVPAARLALPLAAALIVMRLERSLTVLASARPGILPVAMVALMAGLLVAGVRRWLIVTLCFGISLMALRDTFRQIWLPPQIDYVVVNVLYPFGWGLLALLGGVAGTMEALRPGTVWARRCYFGAAAIYLGGHGSIGYLRHPNWESLILLACGMVALVGVFMAHRVVAAEGPPPPEPEDIVAMAEAMRRRGERVASKEWRETADVDG